MLGINCFLSCLLDYTLVQLENVRHIEIYPVPVVVSLFAPLGFELDHHFKSDIVVVVDVVVVNHNKQTKEGLDSVVLILVKSEERKQYNTTTRTFNYCQR